MGLTPIRVTNSPFLMVATISLSVLGFARRLVSLFAVTSPSAGEKPSEAVSVFEDVLLTSVVSRLVFAYAVLPLYESLVQPVGLTPTRVTNSPFLMVATISLSVLGSARRLVSSFAVTSPSAGEKPSETEEFSCGL